MRYLIIMLLLICAQTLFAQQKKLNINFQSADVNRVANELQQQSGYRFFYDANKLTDIKITSQGSDLTLSEALALSFKGTDLKFAIVNHDVYITRGRAIEPALASKL